MGSNKIFDFFVPQLFTNKCFVTFSVLDIINEQSIASLYLGTILTDD